LTKFKNLFIFKQPFLNNKPYRRNFTFLFINLKLKKMKKILLAIILIAAAVACNNTTPKNALIPAATSKEDLIKLGEYLVQITGCNDCHSPKKMGANGPEIIPELMLSGYAAQTPLPKAEKIFFSSGFAAFAPDLTAAAGPWGISFAGNLTPDSTTGIGGWTEEQFKIALTTGKFKGQEGGRMLLPPMPWVNYIKMTDADVKAIFTYLKSIKPVMNAVPNPVAPEKI
jgi:Cytochrome c